MDRRKFFRLLGAGGLLSLMKARAQGAPWTKKTFETLTPLG
jgi:sulfane dehydrogenase subunit SoxC